MTDTRALTLILLDRDGVINVDSDEYVKTADEWLPIEGSINAIVELQVHFQVAVCTNQSGVGRGYFDEDTLSNMHTKMNQLIVQAGGEPLDIWYCPHEPDAGCPCRKPKPALLEEAMSAYQTKPEQTLYIGDSEKDLLAAESAGCSAGLVRTGKGIKTSTTDAARRTLSTQDDLLAFAAFLTR